MIPEFKKAISYYFWATYRRKILDRLLEEDKHYYKGIVLDIGGRDRGRFEKPKDKVEKWVFADIEEKHKPDIVLDITDMVSINDKSIDVINAIETLEHVEKPERALSECHRVLADSCLLGAIRGQVQAHQVRLGLLGRRRHSRRCGRLRRVPRAS